MLYTMLNDVLLPVAVFVLMFITGTGMLPSQFGAVRAFRKPVALCIAAQFVLLPLLAVALVSLVRPDEHVGLALIILAISPAGALSTVYVFMARGNASLSAVLTSVGTLCYILAFPVLTHGAGLAMGGGSLQLSLPVGHMFVQVLAFLVFPICLGLLSVTLFPQWISERRMLLDLATAGLLALVIAISTLIGWKALVQTLFDIVELSAAFTALAFVGGYAIGVLAGPGDREACAIECSVRNVPIAILLARDSGSNETMIGCFVGFYLVNALMLASYSAFARTRNRHAYD